MTATCHEEGRVPLGLLYRLTCAGLDEVTLIIACSAWSHIKNRFVRFCKGRAWRCVSVCFEGIFFPFFSLLFFIFLFSLFCVLFCACTKCVQKDLGDGGEGKTEIKNLGKMFGKDGDGGK